MDLALEDSNRLDFRPHHTVSILVFVDLALEGAVVTYNKQAIVVSILVFVDLALEGWTLEAANSALQSFQSLFSWI